MHEKRRELIRRIESMPDEELAILHAFFCGRPNENQKSKSFSVLSETITDFVRQYAILPNLDGYNYFRTALHIILENPEKFRNSITSVYDLVGKEHDCPGPFVELVMENSLRAAYKACPNYYWEFPNKEIPPTCSEFLHFAVSRLSH